MDASGASRRHFDSPKVAYVLPDPGIPAGGTKGASVHVDALCGAMAREGVSVTLYAAKVAGPLSATGSEGVTVVPVDVGPVRSGPDGDATRLEATRRFFVIAGAALDADRPDWVHERLSLFAGGGTAMAADRDLPRVVEVNAPVADERQAHFALHLATEARQAECDALRGARVVAVSRPMATWALSKGASDATVVPNGADTVGLTPERWVEARRMVREELEFSDDLTVVGFVGSLKPWHGVELLVEAVAAASSQGELGLLIVGDGPQRDSVDAAVRTMPPSVRPALIGAVPSREVPRYLAAMDLAVAPYLPNDCFYFSPLKVVEAMAAGLPVVASDFPPVRELLGSTGALVTAGDLAQLADVIHRLAADPDGRSRMAVAGRARAVQGRDWRAVARRTIAAGLEPDTVISESR